VQGKKFHAHIFIIIRIKSHNEKEESPHKKPIAKSMIHT